MSGFSDYKWERESKQYATSSDDDDDTDDEQRGQNEKMALRQRFAGGVKMGMKGASRTGMMEPMEHKQMAPLPPTGRNTNSLPVTLEGSCLQHVTDSLRIKRFQR